MNNSDNEEWKIQQVDDIYTKTLHPYSWMPKNNRSKSHQNNVQQSTQNKSDFNDIRGALYGKITNTAQESKGKHKHTLLFFSLCLWKFNAMIWGKKDIKVKACYVTGLKVDEKWCWEIISPVTLQGFAILRLYYFLMEGKGWHKVDVSQLRFR
jgi:hypothetical protein